MKGASISKMSRFLRKPWYQFWRLIEKTFYHGRAYTLSVPYGYRVLTPWFDTTSESGFAQAIGAVSASGPLVVSLDRCYILYQFARRSLLLPGHMAECGVYTGGTAHLIAWVLSSSSGSKKLHLFDTFSGMPDTAIPQRDYHSAGDFSRTSVGYVKRRLREYESLCEYHPGLMPETFSEVARVQQYSFVHVDVDIYPSVAACCDWFWQRLSLGGVMVFDDYGHYPYRNAARAAVDQFFANQWEKPIVLPTGQAVAIRTKPVAEHP